jgi:hypothetical protein
MSEKLPIYAEFDSNGNVSSLHEFSESAGDSITAGILDVSISSLDDVSSNLVPEVGDVLVWGGTEWTASADGGSGGGGGGATDLSALGDTQNVENAIDYSVLVKTPGSVYWEPSGAVLVSGTAPPTQVGFIWLDTASTTSGADHVAVQTYTTTFSVATSDRVVLVDCTSSSVSGTLPDPSSVDGKIYDFKKIDSTTNPAVLDGGSFSIDATTNVKIPTQYHSITVVSDGSQWWII